METKKTFISKNLKFLRKLKGITQNNLANAIDLSRNKVASYESGIAEPKLKNLIKIADYYEVNPLLLLSQDLSKHSIESGEDSSEILEINITEKLNQLIYATEEMQKIIDGYKIFQEMKIDPISDDVESKVMVGQLYNILDLSENLLAVNWEFIGSISSFEEE